MINIPGLVLAQLDMHVAKTRLDLETIKAKLEGERVQLTRSRVLRAERDRLTAELAAWEYITAHANGVSIRHELEEKFPAEPVPSAGCTGCVHAPHGAGQCIGNLGLCKCGVAEDVPGIEPAKCENCGHPHLHLQRCGTLIETEARRMSCGCIS